MKFFKLLLVAYLSLWVLSPRASACQEPDEQASIRARVGELAQLLDADKESDRDAAEKELKEIESL